LRKLRRQKVNCTKCGSNAENKDGGIQYINATCELSPTIGKVNKKPIEAEDTQWGVHCVLGVGVV
jgi:hypothetical protein